MSSISTTSTPPQSPYIPDEVWKNHTLSELKSEEIIDSVFGVDKQLTNVGTSQITETLSSHVALVDLFEKEVKLDKLFRNILANPHPINYLDFTKLQERRLYFIPVSQRLIHLKSNTPIEDEELEKIASFAERRKLMHLQELELAFFQIDRSLNLQQLGAIFQLSQITSLVLQYLGNHNDHYESFRKNILKILPSHLTKLVLHNAAITVAKLNIFKSTKFKELKHLDLSSHDELHSDPALCILLGGQLPNLETLILNNVGHDTFPQLPNLKEIVPLNLKKITLKFTYFRDPAFFINQFEKLKSLTELQISLITTRGIYTNDLKRLKVSNPNLKISVFYKYE